MLIRYGFRLMINVCQPTPILTRLDVHPNRRNDIVCEAPFKIAGADAPPVHTDLHGNLCRRLTAFPGDTTFELSGLMTDAGTPEPQLSDEPAWPVEKLPEECLVYLLASRYCETDVLARWHGGRSAICRMEQRACGPLSTTFTTISPSVTGLRARHAPHSMPAMSEWACAAILRT
jgi:hypothetical protein